MPAREGGCICGAVRFRVTNAPFRTSVCHCRFCQRRTGSAFGIGVYFRKADFELLQGMVIVGAVLVVFGNLVPVRCGRRAAFQKPLYHGHPDANGDEVWIL